MSRVDVRTVVPVDVPMNNRASTHPDELEQGAFNVWRNSLPAPVHLSRCSGCPRELDLELSGRRPDNAVADGQTIQFPRAVYTSLHLVGAGERAVDDTGWLCDGSQFVAGLRIQVADLWEGSSRWPGTHLAYRSETVHYPHHVQAHLGLTLWHQRIVAPNVAIDAFTLPINPAIHLFAAFLDVDGETRR